MKLRPFLLWLHRWVGVVAGFIILILALTGGVLVFERRLDRWLNPQLYPAGGSVVSGVSLQGAVAQLQRARPELRIAGLILPRERGEPLRCFAGPRAFHLDPGTGEILGVRSRTDGFFRFATRLHVSLLAGSVGGKLVACATLLTLGMALTGVWLWWPLKIGWFRRGANFRRVNLDLHSVAGLYSSIFLLIVAGTGATIHYVDHAHPRSEPVAPQPGRKLVDLDTAVAHAESALPGARVVSIEMPPPNPRAGLRLQLAFPEDASPAGRSVVFVDPYNGTPLSVHSSRAGSWFERYLELQLSLHTGGIFGAPTRWLALWVCIALGLQVASGYVLWWKRPGGRAAGC